MDEGPGESQAIQVKITNWADEDGAKLRARQREEILSTYPGEPGLPPSADDVPIFIVLKSQGTPVACGGLRHLQDEQNPTAEIKRMFVVPEWRGRSKGIADLLMKHLELQAVERGWRVLRLETAADMVQARKFYERHGFKEIPCYGHYAESSHSVCYEKVL